MNSTTFFRKYDAGKAQREWDTGDCTVRALTVALGTSYSFAWEILFGLQKKHRACSFKLAEFLRRKNVEFGGFPIAYIGYYYAFPAKKGSPRMTGEEFCKLHPKGRFLLRMARHISVAIDGQVVDRWDCSHKCVYGAWEVKKRYGQ